MHIVYSIIIICLLNAKSKIVMTSLQATRILELGAEGQHRAGTFKMAHHHLKNLV